MSSGQSIYSFLLRSFRPTIRNLKRSGVDFIPARKSTGIHPDEIIPISEKKGKRTYVMMHPYVLEPKLTLTVGLYPKPKVYADQDEVRGKTIGQPKHEGFREVQVGNAQAWYYHLDKTIVLWECFFDAVSANTPYQRI